MTTAWRGKAWIGPGMALFVGATGDNGPHRHHAAQLVVAADATARVSLPNRELRAPALWIPADAIHQLHPSTVALLYVEPTSALGRSLSSVWDDDGTARTLPQAQTERLRELAAVPKGVGVQAHIEAVLAAIMGTSKARREPDSRVAAAMSLIDQNLPSAMAATTLATRLAVSDSHLRALFRRDVGVSIKRYRLWAKLRAAIAACVAGSDLTNAAHRAGFADAAHLTRTFRAMFGTAPSNAFKELVPIGVEKAPATAPSNRPGSSDDP